MSQITEYTVEINTLNYNKQYKYVKMKFLFVDSYDISRIIFFKKLRVILDRLPRYLLDLNDEIHEKKYPWFNFRDELLDDTCFDDKNDIMRLKTIKLTNNMYQISIPVKNTPIPVISYVNIK